MSAAASGDAPPPPRPGAHAAPGGAALAAPRRRQLARRRAAGAALLLALALVVAELVLERQAERVPPLLCAPSPGHLAPSPERPLMVPFDVSEQPTAPRILYVGASTEAGYPFGPRAAPAAWVQRVLDSRGVQAELVPVAMQGLTSAETAQLFPQVFALHPAAIVLGLGHNEYLRSGALLEPHWWNRFQLGRRLSAWLGDPPLSERQPTLEHGFDHAAVTAAFRANVLGMVRAAQEHGVRLLLTLPVCNLADFPPVLGDDSRLPEQPDAAWQRGRAALAAGDARTALDAFRAARDSDRWPVRTRGDLIAALRDVAPALIDVDSAFLAASAQGVPGFDLFVDNCHPNMDGLRVLAVAVADGLQRAGVLPDNGTLGRAPPTADLMAAAGLTDADVHAARALLARSFVGLAVMTGRDGELSALARRCVQDALADSPEAGELDTSIAVLALLAGDVPTARARLAAAAQAGPASLGKLEFACRHFPWMDAVFARQGLLLRDGALVPRPPAGDGGRGP